MAEYKCGNWDYFTLLELYITPPPKNHEGASKIDRFDSVFRRVRNWISKPTSFEIPWFLGNFFFPPTNYVVHILPFEKKHHQIKSVGW